MKLFFLGVEYFFRVEGAPWGIRHNQIKGRE
jgi:hypothetical protein